jgi:hypothetical protein
MESIPGLLKNLKIPSQPVGELTKFFILDSCSGLLTEQKQPESLFYKRLWEARKRVGIGLSYRPPAYVAWRNQSWDP